MDADLGLFNQLLEMVDGDWSDSIKGICDHILERFHALGVFISVFDKTYNEFIYIHFSLNDGMRRNLAANRIIFTQEAALETIRKVYEEKKSIVEYGIFSGPELIDLVSIYFDHDQRRAVQMLNEFNLRTVFAVPDMDANKNFTCFFHILTDRDVNPAERTMVNEYLTQLHVALEIVFLVRELYIKATHDSLTRLFNHRQGLVHLKEEIDRVRRNRQPLCVVMMDLDHFKLVNDTYGHKTGDEVLERIGAIMTAGLRTCDVVSRYGGEEFLIILPDTRVKYAVEVCRRLKEKIGKRVFRAGRRDFNVTASFGLVQFGKTFKTVDDVIIAADRMLYRAKENGRDRVEYPSRNPFSRRSPKPRRDEKR